MSVIKVQARAERLRELESLSHGYGFIAVVDPVDLKLIEAVKHIAETLLDQEERIAKLEAEKT